MSGGSGRFRWWVLCCGVVWCSWNDDGVVWLGVSGLDGPDGPVSIDCGQDIWQGMSLDGLWFNIHRLIYYLAHLRPHQEAYR